MSSRFSTRRASFARALTVVVLIALLPGFALADPPPWAPAHGYRAKGKGRHPRGDVVYVVPPVGIDAGHCYRERLGQVLGGAAGAAVGSQIGSGSGQKAAIVAGTIVGFLIGGEIGRSMDQLDQACLGQVLEQAETGRTVDWRNPDQDARYFVTPIRTYQNNRGAYCREYRTVVRVGGESQQMYGTACRQPDGSWKIVS